MTDIEEAGDLKWTQASKAAAAQLQFLEKNNTFFFFKCTVSDDFGRQSSLSTHDFVVLRPR